MQITQSKMRLSASMVVVVGTIEECIREARPAIEVVVVESDVAHPPALVM